jgi:4-amino-4-deoxychorismate lyase
LDRWLINGNESATIPVDDRGFQYGDGLFETIAIRKGECRFMEAHLRRLAEGCRRLNIPVPRSELLLRDIQRATAGAAHGTAKIIITRGSGPRGYRPPPQAEPTRVVGFSATSIDNRIGGIRIRFCNTLIGRNRQLAGIKSLSRLEQVLARSEWNDADIEEGLMLNDKGEVVCGTMTNLFCTRDDVLLTPELSECGIRGVMREQTLVVAAALNIEVRETVISKRELLDVDDLFLTNSLTGAVSVAELDGHFYSPSAVTRKIRRGLCELGVEECAT